MQSTQRFGAASQVPADVYRRRLGAAVLLPGSVVSLARPDFQILVVRRFDFDGAELAVAGKLGGLVGYGVLAAQLILDFREGIRYVLDLEGEECPSAGRLRHALQHLIAFQFHPAHVGADAVNNGLSFLALLDGLLTS